MYQNNLNGGYNGSNRRNGKNTNGRKWAEINELAVKAKKDDEAKVELVKKLGQYVKKIVWDLTSFLNLSPEDLEDLSQEGVIGLLNAIRGYNEEKGRTFSTYAAACIRNGIRKHGLVFTHSTHNGHATLTSLTSLDEHVNEDTELSFVDKVTDGNLEERTLDRVFARMIIEDIYSSGILNEREKGVIMLKFGFDRNGERSLEEIGQTYGYSRQYIMQVENSAISKMRAYVSGRYGNLNGNLNGILNKGKSQVSENGRLKQAA